MIKFCKDISKGWYVRTNLSFLVPFCILHLPLLANLIFSFLFELRVYSFLRRAMTLYSPYVFRNLSLIWTYPNDPKNLTESSRAFGSVVIEDFYCTHCEDRPRQWLKWNKYWTNSESVEAAYSSLREQHLRMAWLLSRIVRMNVLQ